MFREKIVLKTQAEFREEYLKKHLSPIFFKGTHRKIYKEDEIIKSLNLREKDKSERTYDEFISNIKLNEHRK